LAKKSYMDKENILTENFFKPQNILSEGFFKSFWKWFTTGALDRAAMRKDKKEKQIAVDITNKKIDRFEKEFEKIWGTKLNLDRFDASDFSKKAGR
jgi:hypothetical protein